MSKHAAAWVDSFNKHAIWQLPFRSFFLGSSMFSGVSVLAWWLILSGNLSMPGHSLPSIIWHIHEMLFGFAATVAVGFILTAVQTWTGQPSIKGISVIWLFLGWLAVRVLLWINTDFSVLVATCLQGVWWLAVLVIYSSLVIRAGNKRNYLFIPLLSVLAVLNLSMLVVGQLGQLVTALHLAKSAVLLFTLLMGVVGGRVIPFFTVRGAQTFPIHPIKGVEILLQLVSIVGISLFLASHFIELPFTPAPFLIAGGVLHLGRMMAWRSIKTLSIPLLWSLHVAYSFIGLGLIGLGFSYFAIGLGFSSSLHLITIGAIGSMIFSMMSRVSLGHTGRKLEVKPHIVLAFVLLIIAAILRALLPIFDLVTVAWMFSAFCWVLAATLFFFTYWPVLTRPRL